MSSTKNVQMYAALAKSETTYGVAESLSTSTDGLLLDEKPTLTIEYAVDGARPAPPGTLGTQKRVGGGGRTGSVPLRVAACGYGAAYSSSNVPRGHALLKAAGLTATIVTTASSESVTYAPTPGPTGYASATLGLYAHGELYTLRGVYGNLTLAADGPVVPVFEIAAQGVLNDPADASPPSITYPTQSIIPNKATGITFTLGDFTTAKMRSFSFDLGREISPRLNQNAADGHAGFSIGRRAPTLTVTFEAEVLETSAPYHSANEIDPYQLFEAATSMAWSLEVGSTQYNRWTLSGPAAQIAGVERGEDGPSAMWTLTLQLNPSTLNGNDDFSLVFD